MKKIIAIMMLGAFLAGSVATVVAQEQPKKECKKDKVI